jgi:hypothetical protein
MASSNTHLSTVPSSTVIHRPFGGTEAYRRLTDRACRVSVQAFPMAELSVLAAAGLLSAPGVYILADGSTSYVGESVRPARRLSDHAADPMKGFARDVLLVTGSEGAPFDKALLLDLQARFAARIRDVGLRSIWGLCPTEIEVAAEDRSTNDRIFADAVRLIYDTGCRFLDPSSRQASHETTERPPATNDDASDAGPIEIGVSTTPVGMREYELRYDAVWARGYWAADGHFIVAAGSEVRSVTNPSCDPKTALRREELQNAGVLASIPGIDDRKRLTTAVAFPSISVAAKVVCGAHTAGRWLELAPSRAVVLAA